MRLITETTFNDVASRIDESNGKKNWVIEGLYLQSEVVNGNKRKYPKEILKREVDRYVNEFVSKNRAIGELNHPKYPMPDPAEASHKITALQETGNDWIGKANILNTPRGNIIQGLLEGDVVMGVSSRALGSLKESGGIQIVQSDLRLNTIDVVADPSAPDAFVNGLFEGSEWVWDNGVLVESVMSGLRKDLDEGVKNGEAANKVAVSVFTDFLQKINLYK